MLGPNKFLEQFNLLLIVNLRDSVLNVYCFALEASQILMFSFQPANRTANLKKSSAMKHHKYAGVSGSLEKPNRGHEPRGNNLQHAGK